MSQLFSDEFFMPHGHCYLWQPGLLWLQVVSNSLIGLAYVAITSTLLYLTVKGRYVPFKGMTISFGAFIVTCGITHFMDVWVIWHPHYWVDGGIRAVTAVASVGTALLLPPLVPKALALARGARAARQRGVQLAAALEELEHSYEKAREFEQLKTQFFANVSHELRTPLALVLGPVQKLLVAENLSESQRHDLEVVDRNAQTLLKHVNDLMDASKLEIGKLELQYSRFDLTGHVRALAANFEPLARERNTNFQVEAPHAVEGDFDANKLERVVVNLLSNAFKFSPIGGVVRVSVQAESSDELVLEVADSGPGVPPSQRRRVFERFTQIEGGTKRAFGGTGLGLAISHEIVELMGGAIEVEEAPEGGALFRVRLPRRAPSGIAVEEEAPTVQSKSEVAEQALRELESRVQRNHPEEEGDKPLVAIVEDNADMSRFVREVLEASFQCVTAPDGEEGLRLALEKSPDLIITDIMMPKMSGDELVAEVRKHASLDAVPIMLLTAKTDDELRVKLLAEGAQDYLTKPFSGPELRVRAANLVTMKRARETLQREIDAQMGSLEELADEVIQRKRQLSATLDAMRVAKERAEHTSQLKSNFLSMVSHELRSPLGTLRVQLERLRVEEGQDSKKLIQRMSNTVKRFEELIESLLNYARIQSGTLTPEMEELDVTEVAREAVEEVEPRAETKGLRFDFRPPADGEATVQVDRTLLHLVLVNLLSNAVKFTSEGSVSLELQPRRDGVTILVSDTGPGIAQEDLERIFEPFEQTEPIRHKHMEGLGLGLALVRELVASMTGTVRVESEVGRGSAFIVDLYKQPFPLG